MADSRLLRGGSWLTLPRFCRSAFRLHLLPGSADIIVGVRVVCLHQGNDHTIQLEELADD